jgi:ADP-ribosyl-[dinitrogen reductase] hydrolase
MAGDARDRALGALAGLAVGDAVGTTVEFSPRGSFAPLTDMVGGGPFRLAPGQWTDDTSMALCLADALLHDPGPDPADLMDRFLRWRDRGENSSTGTCFDIGIATRNALDRYRRTGNPMAGSEDPHSAGNGAVMRLAPVPVRWWRDPERAEAAAALQTRTTHGAAECVAGSVLLARVLRALIAGEGRAALTCAPDPGWPPRIADVASGTWRGRPASGIRSSGYVVHTLEAALWAVDGTDDFEAAVLRAANLGDDADTVAAVAGQVAGALHGLSGIPARWRARLHDSARIEALAAALFRAGAA